MNICKTTLAATLVFAVAAAAAADNRWPSFQNGGDMSQPDADTSAWTGDLKTVWTTPVEGHGQASPIVWDDRLYVTSTIGPMKEAYRLTCLSAADGKELWRWDVENPTQKENNLYTSRAAPTPAADENGVLVYFEGGVLAALSHEGEVRWQRNLIDEYGPDDTRFGQSASVEQLDGTAFLWISREADGFVLAVDKATGETKWKVNGPSVTSWASPRLVDAPGGKHLVLSGGGTVAGLDPADGSELWRVNGLTGNTTPTPVPVKGDRFLIGASQGRGEISEADAAASNALFEIRQDGDQFVAKKVWGAERATSSFGTPIVHNGTAWFVNRTGVLYGLDVETGERVSSLRLASSMWATPVGVGDLLIVPTKEGVMEFVSADASAKRQGDYRVLPESEQPAEGRRGPFGGATLYGIAVVGERIYARDGDAVYCVAPAK